MKQNIFMAIINFFRKDRIMTAKKIHNPELDEETIIKLKNFELVSDILRARPGKSTCIEEFESLINNEFKELSDKNPGLNDMIEVDRLRYILREMRLIANCPSLHSKNLGAIGGGFSSGKSSFINSFISDSGLRLAVGKLPVTAIPSYVVCDGQSKVQGISYSGGTFDISLEMYKALSHEYLKSLSFNLKEILTYTTVLCPLRDEYFKDLCLIDTPGYNPPNSGTKEHDIETAISYIKEAQFLIWMIGLDQTGTIPASDITFLDALDFGKPDGRVLYIIANKADLKPQDDIESILDNFEECLNDMGFEYAGISAYSPQTKKTYGYRKMDLPDFLKSRNVPSKKFDSLYETMELVFKDHDDEIRRDQEEKTAKRKEIKSLLLDAFEGNIIGADDASNKLEEGLNNLMHYFQPRGFDELFELVKNVREKFRQCFFKFCDETGIKRPNPSLNEPVSDTFEKSKENAAVRDEDLDKAYEHLFGDDKNTALAKILEKKTETKNDSERS
jgi:ribosome biogenesis GTPase A